MRPFNIVVAIDQDFGIGKEGGLPWHLSADLQHFKKVTQATASPVKINAVIMGRKTWDSIPEKFKPLPGRMNIVLTKNDQVVLPESVCRLSGVSQAFNLLQEEKYREHVESVFVIGGSQIFEQTLRLPSCQKLYVTHLHCSFGCDTFFPHFEKSFKQTTASAQKQDNGILYHFAEYARLERR